MIMSFAEQLGACRVLPVITAHDVASTVELARALDRGGMRAAEITLRTEAALDSLAAVKTALPHMLVAAGTVTSAEDMQRAGSAGADFCVSPGITEALLVAATEQGMPFLPGVATASEVLLGLSHGRALFKLFPAVAVGGMNLLKSLQGPFPDVRFCPTGGLTPANYRDFLALPNVICCGGSWMVSEQLVRSADWDKIEILAHDAMQHND
jgi:2-dehydro-3-deoxyphosphogluconate aldolase/(4S)-4-hydroxy-2-oxoglutarate aldolase